MCLTTDSLSLSRLSELWHCLLSTLSLSQFVGGGKSRFLRSSHLPAIQQHFSRFSLSTIRTADHNIHADEPDALLLIALRFLSVAAPK